MLTSPQVVTINTFGQSLSRINNDGNSSVYLKKTTGLELRLTIRHSFEGKPGPDQIDRHNVELSRMTWDAEGRPQVTSAYVVFRAPRSADVTSASNDFVGLIDWVKANVTGLYAWEV